MSPVLGLVCTFALVALATPCCFPNQASFDWKLDMNVSYSHGGVNGQYSDTVKGSAAFDFKKQLFFLELHDGQRFRQKMVLNLGTQRGVAELITEAIIRADPSMSSGAGETKYCSGSRFTGKVGKPWQCIFENQNILIRVDANDGEAEYLLLIPEIVWGPITMQKDVCLPLSGYLEVPFSRSGPGNKALVYFEMSNMIEKVDASVFDAPCKPEPGSYMGSGSPPFPVPTPDELVEIIRAQMPPTDSPATPASEIESEIQVEEEDQESHSSEAASSEGASSEGASSEGASSETRRRRCIIPGAFGGCY